MNYGSESPEDATCVIKIMEELNSFVGEPRTSRKRKKLSDFMGTPARSTSFRKSSNSTSTLLCETQSTLSVEEKAELIAAKAKVSSLEGDVSMANNRRKMVEIELEKLKSRQKQEESKKKEEYDNMTTSYRHIIKKEELVREDLAKLQQEYDALKKKYEEESKAWIDIRIQMNAERDEVIEASRNETFQLREKYARAKTENQILQNQLQEAEEQGRRYKSRHSESLAVLKEFTDLKTRCECAENRVKELEGLESRREEATRNAKMMEKQLANYRKLERENVILRDDLQLMKDASDNALILQEKVDNLTTKLEKAERKIEDLRGVEFENETLKDKLGRVDMHNALSGESRSRSPLELTRVISEMQRSHLVMAEKQGELEASLSVKNNTLDRSSQKCSQLSKDVSELKTSNSQLEDKCQKLQRRLTLANTERDGMRRVLASYESENSPQSAKQLIIKEGQKQLEKYAECVNDLESQLDQAKEGNRQLQSELESFKQKEQSSNSIQDSVELLECRKQVETLQHEKEELVRENKMYVLKFRKQEKQGDFNPLNTRVLSLKNSIMTQDREKYFKERENLEIENAKLRKKVIHLQMQADKREEEKREEMTSLNETMDVSRLIKTSKPMEELKKELESEKEKYAKLKKGFQKEVQLFRGAALFLGYDIVKCGSETFKFSNVYSEREEDYFIAMVTEDQTALQETPYLEEMRSLADEYAGKGDSYAAFFAAVTLELFSRQTMIMDKSIANRARQM